MEKSGFHCYALYVNLRLNVSNCAIKNIPKYYKIMGWKNFYLESGFSLMSGYVSTTVPKTSPAGHPPCSLLHKQPIDVDVESHIPEFIHNLPQNAAPPS